MVTFKASWIERSGQGVGVKQEESAYMTNWVAQNGARLLWIWRVILAILRRRQCSSRRWKFSKARKI
jgi:hypothetical protein